jgi:hypothetical protein
MKTIFNDINKHMLSIALLIMAVTVSSCSKWDDYKKYTAGGEIIYPVNWIQ